MSTLQLPWQIVGALRVIIGEDFDTQTFQRLESKRNQVYKIIGFDHKCQLLMKLVAKWYQHAGIANETSVLQEAFEKQIPVPRIIGTTADVLLTQFVEGPNLCDLVTKNPVLKYGRVLGKWLAQYHMGFHRTNDQVLVKGDARIRNFIFSESQLFGVDFEESHYASFHKDLAQAYASILDTTPLFTVKKFKICKILIKTYTKQRKIKISKRFKAELREYLLSTLKETAARRDNPPDLIQHITKLEKRKSLF